MKFKSFLTAILALAFIVGSHAQDASTNAVILTVPPVPRPIQQIVPVKLDAPHSAQFLAAISAVVTLPAGTIPVSGGYRLNADGTVTIFGSVRPVAPVTTQ